MPKKVPEPNQYVLLEGAVTLLNGCPILVQSNPMMLMPAKTRSCYCVVGSTEKLAYSFIVFPPLQSVLSGLEVTNARSATSAHLRSGIICGAVQHSLEEKKKSQRIKSNTEPE